MNIFIHEWKSCRKSTLIWSLSLACLTILLFSMFPAIARDAEEFKSVLQGFPEPVRKAIGLEIDSIATLLGFYSYVFLYVSLCGAIQAMNLGTSLLTKEILEKTADFLLTKPITRKQVLTSKLLAAVASLIITNIFFITAANIMASIVKTGSYSMSAFVLISASLFLLQLIFLAIGILVSVIVPRIKSVLSVSLATVFGFFMLGIFGSAAGDEAMRYITPFKYFDPAYIVENSAYEPAFLALGAVIIVAAISAVYYIYSKRDIAF
ncbi:ABC transporter permease subunit [Bacillus sp. ISL-47]|uniref:ABC transporter permease subunit n=1 Tax=Bacillus sp. ISL-47 TaxID=2819130 RepID=UPI001BE4FAE5|nr:ABC transporter permease subunit [Bacillus sp. ISL-47]MBT2688228.1 ABC transporter permease subunit [Bacillus sp. ISL-47]MBT2710021.1 ABC transporter permease subunit [Pseudomonas sp. ISL-84]